MVSLNWVAPWAVASGGDWLDVPTLVQTGETCVHEFFAFVGPYALLFTVDREDMIEKGIADFLSRLISYWDCNYVSSEYAKDS